MCGIVAGISNKNVLPVLIDGLERLEYRGYDSAGIAILNEKIQRIRSIGRVASLKDKAKKTKLKGFLGIGHTRWATHGGVTEDNAHPHVSNNQIAVVHNGIIENHEDQCRRLKKLGYKFESETDTEVIAHLIHYYYNNQNKKDLLKATNLATKDLMGAYAIAVISVENQNELICARFGCPLIIGQGKSEYFIASDITALLEVTRKIIYLEDGDLARVKVNFLEIYGANLKKRVRKIHHSKVKLSSMDLGPNDHFMQKEIYEQPRAIGDTIEAVIDNNKFEFKFRIEININMDLNIGYRRGAVMRNPYVSEEDANHIVDNFYNYVTGQLPIPEEFMGEAPGASETAPTRVEGLAEAQIIATIFKEAEIKKDNLRQSRKKKKYDVIPLTYIQGHEY